MRTNPEQWLDHQSQELEVLNSEARDLEEVIAGNVMEILERV